MTEGAWIEGNTVHIVIDFGDLAIHREGVEALAQAITVDFPAWTVEMFSGKSHPLLHACEACGAPATRCVRLNDEGDELVWFCEACQ